MTDAYQRFSPARIWTLATSTVTQLVRMKIVAFLAVFCVIVVAAAFAFPGLDAEQQLKQLKSVSFGAQLVFALIIAIVATALLLPKDVEDRTLYTILAKPVPRVDYLLGKLFGVLMLMGAGLIVMQVVCSAVLWIREGMVVSETIASIKERYKGNVPPEAMASVMTNIHAQGLAWSLHLGTLAIFLKGAVIASLALLISTFASSTLFTVISAFCMTVLGHGEGLLREYFMRGDATLWQSAFSIAIAIICPDLSLFEAVDAVVIGKAVSATSVLYMVWAAALYVIGYTAVACFLFKDKEL